MSNVIVTTSNTKPASVTTGWSGSYSESAVDMILIRKVQEGEKVAFDMLVVKYQHKVATLISRFVYDHHEVQDLTQQTFINAYRGLKNFRGESAFYTWLYTIAKNTALKHLGPTSRQPPLRGVDYDNAEHFDSVTGLRDIVDPHSELATDEIATTVRAAINNLPVELQSAITLREFQGLSYEQIAVIMNCPIGTVRSRISRARKVIEEQILPLLNNTD